MFMFRKNEQEIEGSEDADWTGAVEDRRSTTGYLIKVWGNLVTWRNKKQLVAACSSAERNLKP